MRQWMQPRRWPTALSVVLLALSLGAVFAATIALHFRPDPQAAAADWPQALILPPGALRAQDALHNLLLFFPFGLALGALFLRRGFGPSLVRVAAVAGCAALLSYSVEVSQRFLMFRYPAMVDVATNTGGALLGAAAAEALAWGGYGGILAVYALTAWSVSFLLQRMASLETWDTGFFLVVGNEKTGDRPWNGGVDWIFVSDRAIGVGQRPAELGRRSSEGVLFRDFQREGTDDDGGVRLLWRGAPGWSEDGDWAKTGEQGWLLSERPLRDLQERIRRRSAFTVAVRARPAMPDQRGAGRLLSLSRDPNQRNVSLLQQGNDLVCRLRTAVTGANGNRPPLLVENVFADGKAREILVRYDGGRFEAYVDGQRAGGYQLGPGAAALSYLQPAPLGRLALVEFLYASAVLLPFAVLLGVCAGRSDSYRAWRLFAGALLGGALFEASLAFACQRQMRLSYVLFSVAIVLVAGGLTSKRASGAGR